MRVSPMTGYVLHRDAKVLDAQRHMARAFNLPIVWGTSPDLDGRTLSIAREAGIPAMYTEWQGSGECDREGVDAEYEGCLNVLGQLGMIVREAPPSRIKHVFEDDREQSGHMQINYPSPMAGFFEPSVELEQFVKAGDPLGIVTDFLGERTETVLLTQTGIVLTLRTFNCVHEGDCLGVIIDSCSR
jgi:predicted deacylase